MKRLDGKVVLITGVAAGIGRATANLFAKEGARIVGADIDEAGGTSITTKVQAFGGNMTFVKTDMSYEPDIKALFEVARNLGGVDVLFNNAGIETAKGILETTEEDWDQCVNVNLKSVFLSCKYAILQMKEKGKGVIINNSSVAGLVGSFSPAYSAAKGGIIALTKALAADFGQYNIRVNCICPGAIETPMLERVIEKQGNPTDVRDRRLKNYPLGRFGYPDEVAQTALFLASEESTFVTGATIVVDGGFTSK
ncbi:MAG: SDR family NAD(P)-dependent oxidoreductase [Candidatus Thorarchaeota archaeon]|jgi:NAD(P)-dependent dehydrogenase (short-subunit alcohol dehydrogenase family)